MAIYFTRLPVPARRRIGFRLDSDQGIGFHLVFARRIGLHLVSAPPCTVGHLVFVQRRIRTRRARNSTSRRLGQGSPFRSSNLRNSPWFDIEIESICKAGRR